MSRPIPETMEDVIRDMRRKIGELERRGQGGTVPIGGSIPWWSNTAPTGWALLDGSAISRVDNPILFGLMGTTYGAGNGTTTFNLPNTKGKVIVARDAAQTEFDTLGETGGAKTHQLTIPQIPAHQHQQKFSTHAIAAGGGSTLGGMTNSGGNQDGNAQQYTNLTGGDDVTPGVSTPHNNLQPYIVANQIIRLG